MDVAEVLPLHLELELPEGLNEWHALNVSDRTSQLVAHNIGLNTRHMYRTHVSAHYATGRETCQEIALSLQLAQNWFTRIIRKVPG